MSREIIANTGQSILVDDSDYEWLNSMAWHITPKDYASHTEKGKRILMHRLILNTPKGMLTDHIDRNRLNNTRANLRICTHHENCFNRKKNANNTSDFKGVNWDKKDKKWRAKIYYKEGTKHLGSYTNKMDAAKAYNDAAIKLYGQFAALNPIPDDWKINTRNLPKSDILNIAGKRIAGTSSKYKGVSKTGDKWSARIKVDGKLKFLGRHPAEDVAGLAYNKAAKEAWGDMAYQNPIGAIQ